jgi:hypothetical protein
MGGVNHISKETTMADFWNKWKLELIPDLKDAWKFLSVQAATLVLMLDISYDQLPALRAVLPEGIMPYTVGIVIVARIIQWRRNHDDEDTDVSNTK